MTEYPRKVGQLQKVYTMHRMGTQKKEERKEQKTYFK